MASCEFARYDTEGNVTYRCTDPHYTQRFFGHDKPMVNLCDDHYFWMPDMKWWKPDDDPAPHESSTRS